eukprot:506740-Hanusia_phi.AAC.1
MPVFLLSASTPFPGLFSLVQHILTNLNSLVSLPSCTCPALLLIARLPGHFDLLIGKNAREECWFQVLRFLQDHDSKEIREGSGRGGD